MLNASRKDRYTRNCQLNAGIQSAQDGERTDRQTLADIQQVAEYTGRCGG